MDKINWASYNHVEFTLFCNALFTFEFGKDYCPFSAPGRDGGIDGSYSGSYHEKKGNWRFQYKFHLASPEKALSQLKYQVKGEAQKLGVENFFVLATNVELLPQHQEALSEAFTEQVEAIGKKCEILILDGTKLFNLFLKYPILDLWLKEGFKTAQLRKYEDVYNEGLNSRDFKPQTMSNFFVGRESDIRNLELFLDSKVTTAIITGEAGIGKTRLVLEFFRSKVDNNQTWVPLVLLSRHIDFDKIYKALFPENKYVVLIDDAHTFDPSVIADIKTIADSLTNIKLILTARRLEAFNALRLLKEYEKEQILDIQLTELSRDETANAFLRHLSDSEYVNYTHYIDQLVEISFGKPILIVAMLNAIFDRISIHKIKEGNFLKRYVYNYFDSYTNKSEKETGISRLSVKRLLQAVALLEPFNFKDKDVIKNLADALNIDCLAIEKLLHLLIENGIVNGRYEQSIKPDYYSDIILSEIEKNFIIHLLNEFPNLSDNVIINLSSVDEVKRSESWHMLDEILETYVKGIETSTDIKVINKILSTIRAITFVIPMTACNVINLYMKCLAVEGHTIKLNLEAEKKYISHSNDAPPYKIISILDQLNEIPQYYDFVYRSAFRLYRLTDIMQTVNIFAFDKKDIVEQFSMGRQSYFLNQFNSKFISYSIHELTLGLNCLKNFSLLDFTLTEWSLIKRESISITAHFLPESDAVKNFRSEVLALLLKLYRTPEAEPIKTETLKHILDIPGGILATRRNTRPYHNDVEIETILEFLKLGVNSFNLAEKKEIQEKLYWYREWGLPAKLLPLLQQVCEAFQPKNLVEELSQIFLQFETNFRGIDRMREDMRAKCKEIVNSIDMFSLANSISTLLKSQGEIPHPYWDFQDTLVNDYPEYAKALHNTIYTSQIKLYNALAPGILSTLHFLHHDDEFYWNQVNTLQQLDSVFADNVLLSVYAYRVPHMTPYSNRDIDVIINVFRKDRKENHYLLSMAIQALFATDHSDSMEINRQFLDRVNPRETRMFFVRLSDNKAVTTSQLTDLLLNNTIRYNLSYEIEKCLNQIIKDIDLNEVFLYFLKRYEYQIKIIKNRELANGYDFVPNGKHSSLFNGFLEGRLVMFKKAVEWYLDLNGDYFELFYAKDLLSYLQPSQSLSEDLDSFYGKLIENFAMNAKKFERLLETISVFHVKDERLLNLILKAYPYINEWQDKDDEAYKSLRSQSYFAITIMGTKSGTSGQPFQVDLDLKNLLESTICKLPEYLPERAFLESVLKSVNAEIDRSSNDDNTTWQ